ncbi:50S ribosomal protein L4 [Verrucomicrobiales bacterium]|jgi:large subunit ribosomal protein L4|nr:50S ribosomal protein L4 [Verrucomicrobiales bacterium]|tara:strand:- start:2452 stop:3063 length:612 start_codon:yes stop_codon:yes gene_type:complete
MSANVLTIEAAKAAQLGIPEERETTQAVHDVIVAMRANRRSGTANTKTRGEVSQSGRKPFRQKGTGNARQGGNASPINRGGGVVFGPRPRDYSKQVNKKTKRLAFASALSDRISAGDVLAVDDFKIDDGKTRSFVSKIKEIAGTEKILVVSSSFTDKTYLAARNIADSKLSTALEVNTEELLAYEKVVLTESAMATLSSRTAG